MTEPVKYNCTDIELLLCDYVDRTLDRTQREAFEAHTHSCPACAELVADVTGAVDFVERCAVVEPPPELITRIIHELPVVRTEQKVRRGFSAWLAQWLQPVLQPRFAMGMAMTILSFSMLGKFAGPIQPIKPSDLDPVKVWAAVDDRAHRVWNNTVKYYESLKLVYEIQTRLREWNQEEEQEQKGQQSGEKK